MSNNLDINSCEELETFDDLQNMLGAQFVIFCGSAVSSVPVYTQQKSIFLPMVGDIRDWFLSELASHLRNQGRYQQIIARYAEVLIGGEILKIRFEDFLWQMQEVCSEHIVKSFLQALFMCDTNQFTPNHTAIAILMDTGHALACLTTNFDNAIEQAMKIIKSTPIKCVHPDNIPKLQEFNKGRYLLKLHGDVEENTYVATTSALMLGEQAQEYRYVETLLEGKTVLVLGYSGDGDIDISPYLLKSGNKELIWVVVEGNTPPSYAKHYFVSDLHSFNPDRNCLLKLAGYQDAQTVAEWPEWKERANNWFQNADLNLLQRIIPRLLQDRSTWSILHLHHVYQWDVHDNSIPVDDAVVELNRGIACISVGIYFSGLWILDKVSSRLSDDFSISQLYFWRGFANWRLGLFNRAQRNLNLSLRYFDDATKNTSRRTMPGTGVFDYSPMNRIEIIRIHLETYRDELAMYRSYQKRKVVYQTWELDQKIADFEISGIKDAQQRLLGNLVILDIRHLLGENIDLDYVLSICERSYDLDNTHVASASARLLLHIDYQKGIEWIDKTADEKYRAQTAEALSRVKPNLIGLIVSRIKLSYVINKYGNIFYKFLGVILRRELVYLLKRWKWRRMFVKREILCELKPASHEK